MRKLSARWVPRFLTVDQRHTRQNMSLANLNLFETDPDKFLLRCVTMDETWVQHFIPNYSLNNGITWITPPKKTKSGSTTGKFVVSVFLC